RSHWSTSKTPSYTKSVSWQHHRSNKQHSDRECLYKAEVTMTGKGTRFQEWMPVFFTVNILALVIPGYLQKSSITMTERG
ncbi:hypothetical protein SNB97_12100, partial [Escherichia coli]|nr:hypothetical protein [Escherichia coli]